MRWKNIRKGLPIYELQQVIIEIRETLVKEKLKEINSYTGEDESGPFKFGRRNPAKQQLVEIEFEEPVSHTKAKNE